MTQNTTKKLSVVNEERLVNKCKMLVNEVFFYIEAKTVGKTLKGFLF